jgi:4a-hydroxytetrahydrobiopterin dehydratase
LGKSRRRVESWAFERSRPPRLDKHRRISRTRLDRRGLNIQTPTEGLRMESLSSKHCVPCHGGVPRLTNEEIEPLLRQLDGWRVVAEHHLLKDYEFTNFADALSFVNRVGRIAEQEGHHPDINFGWGYAQIKIYTHAIDGLSESDFILAAKIDEAEAQSGSRDALPSV